MGDVRSIEEHTAELQELSQGKNLVLHRITRGYQEALLVKNTPNLRERTIGGTYHDIEKRTRNALQRLEYLETLSDITFTNVLSEEQQSLKKVAETYEFQEDAEIVLGVTSTGQPFHLVIHNTRQGPPVGGIRSHDYTVRWDDQAISAMLFNNLRLVRTTTLQAALTRTRTGGGTLTRQRSRNETIQEKAQALYDIATAITIANSWRISEGKQPYYAIEHDGTLTEDLENISLWTPYTLHSHASTAPFISEGLHECILTGTKHQGIYHNERHHLKELTILVQGLNPTAREVINRLLNEGATIIATSNNEEERDYARFSYQGQNISVVEPPRETTSRNWFFTRYAQDAHIALACGMSLTWNEETLQAFQQSPIKLVAGSAWHQYSHEDPTRQAREWHNTGILVLPDTLVNAGGLIATTPHLPKRQQQDEKELFRRTRNLSTTLETILEQARHHRTTPWEEAQNEAERRLNSEEEKEEGTY